ncbi:MAG TPA: HTTM domain-containing protein [Actinomycetota bacterium]|nr:HTTM domain-containing protein [Actinomycetota bacterium]
MTASVRARGRMEWLADRFAVKHRLIGSSLLRLGLGGAVAYHFASSWPERRYLWGADGAHPLEIFNRTNARLGPSLFAVQSEALFDVLYLAGLLVAIAYLVGWHTRVVAIPFVVLTWSLLSRNPLALNGGDTLLFVTLPYLLFLDSSACFSFDSRRKAAEPRSANASTVIAALHNLALVCLLVQLCIVYGANCYNKLLGDTWIDGTALGIVFRLAEYEPPLLAGFLAGSQFVQASIGYFTLAFEGAFPFLIWSRKGRVVAVVLAVLLHGGTILFMGLVAFGLRMIVYQTVLLSDDQYLRLAGRRGVLARRSRQPATSTPADAAT